ncbi:response regulator transcription factor [Microbacterium sp. Sa4CUA7]|uniref:Response regulator transcription factor n=2 Tax=Microbacterium pullorum TaxID=2762236 RepID=A0ABR8S6Y4_9MICO|nr:response regulator transcription factor [Microbacterium pullorum]
MRSRASRIRVLIADDNRAVRRGLRLQLDAVPDITVIGEVSNGIDAVTVARSERADVVLMDLQMTGLSGIDATRALVGHASENQVSVIIMTSFARDGYVADALDAGAVGYLLKSHDSAQVVDAIYAASRGDAVVSARVTASMLREFVRRGKPRVARDASAMLTVAERRVVATLSSGITSNEDIALHLHLSVHTVRSQLQSALKKSGTADRTQLALWGVRNDLSSEAT